MAPTSPYRKTLQSPFPKSPDPRPEPLGAVESAKSDAFRLIARRPRSRKEIRTRLEERNYPERTIQIALNDLSDLGYLDDLSFSREWCHQRMESRPRGARGLRRELIQKGVSSSIAEEAINEVFAAENENLVIKRLVVKRIKKGNKMTGPKEIRRMKDFLVRRGFSFEAINQVLSSIDGELGEAPSIGEWDNTPQFEGPNEF